MPWPILLLFAFACGSVPFGFLIAAAKGIDIRKQGSGNIGATNVGRVLGHRWGFACFGLDALKGAVPVLTAGWLHELLGQPLSSLDPTTIWLWLATGVCALLGHMFSPWIGFKGGKGVATGFGAFVAMWTPLTIPTLTALMVWVVCVKMLRMVSIASIIAATAIPLTVAIIASLAADRSAAFRAAAPVLVVSIAITLLVTWKHRGNIARALRGEERKVQI
ncbi:MAG: glycerol-3-phosphate 1-O-acyltransferase PlsY [Phycisphaerae bacterium]|nr:glycerol-3-phosphate 1-O-acyltransferase PlsY [Phycisphaerae bacterium]